MARFGPGPLLNSRFMFQFPTLIQTPVVSPKFV
jgi:hypothetical protein